eukprot:2438853-Prymnesium_polylepis.1
MQASMASCAHVRLQPKVRTTAHKVWLSHPARVALRPARAAGQALPATDKKACVDRKHKRHECTIEAAASPGDARRPVPCSGKGTCRPRSPHARAA